MPIEGLPDPKRHAICRKCRQWHPRQDGDVIWPPVVGLMSFVRVRAARIADAEQLKQFWCRPCQASQAQRSARAMRSAILSLVMLGAVGLGLWWFGVIDQIASGFSLHPLHRH